MNKAWKAIKLATQLNLNSLLAFVFYQILGLERVVHFHTKIGKVGIRTNSTDMKVLYSVLLTEYRELPKLQESKIIYVDLGAYTGLSALAAKHYLGVNSIICVEPNGRNFEMLQTNLQINDLANTTLLRAALSDVNRTVKITSNNLEQWSYSEFRRNDDLPAEECDGITLEHFNLSKKENIFLKVDIEGSEVHLLSDTNLKLLLNIKYIFIEFHDRIVPGIEEKFMQVLKETHEVQTVGQEKLLFSRVST